MQHKLSYIVRRRRIGYRGVIRKERMIVVRCLLLCVQVLDKVDNKQVRSVSFVRSVLWRSRARTSSTARL